MYIYSYANTCMCIHIHVYMYINTHIHIHTYTYICRYTHIYVYIYIYICICMYWCIFGTYNSRLYVFFVFPRKCLGPEGPDRLTTPGHVFRNGSPNQVLIPGPFWSHFWSQFQGHFFWRWNPIWKNDSQNGPPNSPFFR